MSGKPGRSGSRPLSAQHHLLHGSWRANRHGALAAATVPVTSRDVEISPRTVQRIASGLGPAGRRFVRRMIRDHEGWGAVDFEVLRLVGRAVDRIEAFDEAIGSTVVVTGPRGTRAVNPLLAAQRAEVSQLLALMRRLGSEGEN